MISWREERSQAAATHQARLQARKQAEHAQAARLIEQFVTRAGEEQLPTEPLRVIGYGGRGSARTPYRGWYVRTNRKAAIDPSGNFYVLTAPLSLWDRIRGTNPTPSRPPLILGRGGRDGDSLALVDALERLLPGWRDR